MLYILLYRSSTLCSADPQKSTINTCIHDNLRLRGVVLREVLVVVGVINRLGRVARCERLRVRLAVDVVVGAAVGGEVGGLGTRAGISIRGCKEVR